MTLNLDRSIQNLCFVHVATIKLQMFSLEIIPIHWYVLCLEYNTGHFNEEEWPQFSEM